MIWCQYTRFSVSSLLNLIPQVNMLKCNIVSINLRQPVFGFSEEFAGDAELDVIGIAVEIICS